VVVGVVAETALPEGTAEEEVAAVRAAEEEVKAAQQLLPMKSPSLHRHTLQD
tara:strand:- start:133 stop:288 length:156 start_codon:yes stop_codon:yes gene_type:complete